MTLVLGPVVRLQVQRGRLKPGERGSRVYDPAPLHEVDALHVSAAGCLGRSGDAWLVDVHHAAHPDSRHTPHAPVSLLTTGSYRALRERFGPHLADGVAGENVLVDSDRVLADEVARAFSIGAVLLESVAPAEPCVEFARWCARLGPDASAREDLIALLGGARGWYGVPVAGAVVSLGDVVRLA